MKALVTGGKGFVGKHLVEWLKKQNKEVLIFDVKDGNDLRNYELVRNILDKMRPDEIYHLAAQAYVPESINDPQRTFEINVGCSINILEAVRNLGIKTKILLAGTSEEYGSAGDGCVTEETLPTPLSPYAVSKLAMDNMGIWYAKTFGMDVVVTRAFNHAGAGRGEMYAESAFAKQIVEIERGERDILQHGNLTSVRNYTDVRDVVRAYTKAIKLPSGVYNICSDNNVTMQEILDGLIKLSKKKIKTKEHKGLYRASDFSFSTPSCEKFTKLTGWEPSFSLEEMLLSILEVWRDRS